MPAHFHHCGRQPVNLCRICSPLTMPAPYWHQSLLLLPTQEFTSARPFPVPATTFLKVGVHHQFLSCPRMHLLLYDLMHSKEVDALKTLVFLSFLTVLTIKLTWTYAQDDQQSVTKGACPQTPTPHEHCRCRDVSGLCVYVHAVYTAVQLLCCTALQMCTELMLSPSALPKKLDTGFGFTRIHPAAKISTPEASINPPHLRNYIHQFLFFPFSFLLEASSLISAHDIPPMTP